MSDIQTKIRYVEKRCKARGKHLTSKRKLVLEALIHADKALSAYDIVDYCMLNFSQNIQAMSVYRILEFLENEHFAHKLKVSNKYIICSHILCEYEHGVPQFLICSKCNKINEQIIAPQIINELKSHAKQQGFTIINPQLEINCVCEQCAKSS
ncbi:Fur family transcriptional regulator [Aliivibrio fischeri]|uniref:Fur family transcriptional regulator n=1 Tax=Aliivibrio fischeri TaxID=668 RepID=UPI0012D87C26|nr:transcriptional repressor [Aliivibrio fischeri]MUI54825.1 transcriptional repressor [Aliivibrio fischeri]